MIRYFIERAKGGVGLITSGLVPVSFGIDHSIIELDKLTYFPRIDRSRTVFAGWRDLAAGVHAYGAKFFIQLTPGLGRVGNPQCLINSLKLPVSASWNPNFYMAQVPCMPLSGRRLKKIIKNAGQAAADAKAANIDGCYLHGHEGYLLEQLTNPAFNRRKLGHFADWQAFGLDMVREIRRPGGGRLSHHVSHRSFPGPERNLRRRHERLRSEEIPERPHGGNDAGVYEKSGGGRRGPVRRGSGLL